MKIYVDLSCDKVSGQQIVQRAFRDYCVKSDLYATKENADVLVYVQVPFDQDIEEWRQLKQQGKKIVFIHHYLVKDIINNVAIFKVQGLLELVDLHIIMSVYGDMYDTLISRNVVIDKIRVVEQAAVNRNLIEEEFFYLPRERKSICYVGRAKKGLTQFLELTKYLDGWKKTIFCPDIEKLQANYDSYIVCTYLTGRYLFKEIAQHSFMYSPYVYHQPFMHLETSIHEATHCGTAVVVDNEFENVVPNFRSVGFVSKYKFTSMSEQEIQDHVQKCSAFLYRNFQDILGVIKQNLYHIYSICR